MSQQNVSHTREKKNMQIITAQQMQNETPICNRCKVFHLELKLTTLMAARGKKHLKIMFTVLPSFKLQIEKDLSIRGTRNIMSKPNRQY
uniref:Uncharacterized protein n=1 Tax=Malurus cyaneus samueli TaxID=2593467 RepID=A0A8C5TST4_9PASS